MLVGSLRRARQLFSEELTRLEVTLDERAALDCLLDEMADQFDMSRQTLVRGYLGEETVRELARRAAAEATGWVASLHAASQRVAQEHPHSADWPPLVRNYLIDHYTVGFPRYCCRSGYAAFAEGLCESSYSCGVI